MCSLPLVVMLAMFSRSYSNELDVSGTQITLEKAFQCDITQWGVMLGFNNKDKNIDYLNFRTTLMTPELAPGKKVAMTSGSNRFIFDGKGHSSEHGDGCEAQVAELWNDTHAAGIALTFHDCKMRPKDGGNEVVVSGELFCTGKGYKPIQLK